MNRPFEGESCIKSIGPIARAIEAMSFEDFALWIIAAGRAEAEKQRKESDVQGAT